MAEENELDTIIDFSENIEDAEAPSPIPKADYIAEIRGVTPRLSNNSGNRYAEVQFVIPAEEYPADWEDATEFPDGLEIRYRRLLLEDNKRARYQVRMFAEKIGASASGKKIDLASWVGCRAKVTVDHQLGLDGLPRAEIVNVQPED